MKTIGAPHLLQVAIFFLLRSINRYLNPRPNLALFSNLGMTANPFRGVLGLETLRSVKLQRKQNAVIPPSLVPFYF
jgi:hypothetical protein